jgi:predicted kinase
MEAVIFVGIQGSGKTTLYRERFFESHIRLNLDMLRTRHREKLLFLACLEAKAKFVVDNTNTLKVERARYILTARQSKFRVIGYYFIPDLQGCLSRNAKRANSVSIPEKAIVGTRRQLQEPAFDEGFDELYHVEILDNGAFQVWEIEQ